VLKPKNYKLKSVFFIINCQCQNTVKDQTDIQSSFTQISPREIIIEVMLHIYVYEFETRV
jgi:hypothetical protein